MGIIIAKFRKKKTTLETLEKLDNEIKSIEEFRRSTEQTQKRMVARFILISICVYCITALILYFYFLPASVYDRILYIIPLIILPVFLFFIKRILNWYYSRKISKNQTKLTTLKDEKKKILEEVMDKETYKVAKKILEKFAPEQVKRNISIAPSESTPLNPKVSGSLVQTGIRYRGSGQFSPRRPPAWGPIPTPDPRRPLVSSSTPVVSRTPNTQIVSLNRPQGTPMLLPREILPRDRSVFDKMVDYLVGDGPSNKFALICRNCSSHNGLVFKEEFEYLSFRCGYCFFLNPSRKKRPSPPKLEATPAIREVSDVQSGSSSDSENDGPIVTEPPENDPASSIENIADAEVVTSAEKNSGDNLTQEIVPEESPMEVDSVQENTPARDELINLNDENKEAIKFGVANADTEDSPTD